MKRKIIRLLALFTAAVCLFSGCAPKQNGEDGGSAKLQIYCFSAGKADAFLLWNDSFAVLIDTGESGFGKTIISFLKEQGIRRLDYLIITHFDKDHVGGAKKILESVEIGTVLQSNSPKDASAYNKYVTALQAQKINPVTVTGSDLKFTLDGVDFTVNPPAQAVYPEDESNNSSLIVSVICGETRLLFTGDAEDLRLSEYLQTDPGHYDLVKLPHHGRWQATLVDLLSKTTPSHAIITSSEEEPEDDATVALLRESNTAAWLTRTAPIYITSDGRTLTVTYDD